MIYMPMKSWILEENQDTLKIKMHSNSFMVQIDTSSKIVIFEEMKNLMLFKGWLREAYFELMWRLKENKNEDFGDSDDTIVITRIGSSITVETQGRGISNLTREELVRTRRELVKIIYEIHRVKRKEIKSLALFADSLVDFDNMGP